MAAIARSLLNTHQRLHNEIAATNISITVLEPVDEYSPNSYGGGANSRLPIAFAVKLLGAYLGDCQER